MTSKPWASKCFIYRHRKLLRADGGIRVSLQYLKFCKIRKDDWRARADAGKSLGYESEGSMEELHDLRPWVTCNCVRREMRRWRRASRPWQDFLESVLGAKMEPSCGLLEERGIISCSFSGGERDNFNRGRWRWSSERLLGEMLHSSSLSLSFTLFFLFFCSHPAGGCRTKKNHFAHLWISSMCWTGAAGGKRKGRLLFQNELSNVWTKRHLLYS